MSPSRFSPCCQIPLRCNEFCSFGLPSRGTHSATTRWLAGLPMLQSMTSSGQPRAPTTSPLVAVTSPGSTSTPPTSTSSPSTAGARRWPTRFAPLKEASSSVLPRLASMAVEFLSPSSSLNCCAASTTMCVTSWQRGIRTSSTQTSFSTSRLDSSWGRCTSTSSSDSMETRCSERMHQTAVGLLNCARSMAAGPILATSRLLATISPSTSTSCIAGTLAYRPSGAQPIYLQRRRTTTFASFSPTY
mmetsp:Transcript_2666/g.7970  ORF Transcript_2666/g.7970 Transcript_2666/m.7970 type:complete len:245 (+) Transcript_2666:649-1383(+)